MVGTVHVVPNAASDVVNSLSTIGYASLVLAIVAILIAMYAAYRRK